MYIETTPTDRLVTFRYQNDPDYGSEIIDFTQLKQDLVVTIQEQSGVWSADHSFAQIAEAVEHGVLVRLVDETNSRCAIIGEFGEDSFTFVTNDGQTCYAYTVTDADAWSLTTSPVINIADDLTTDDPDMALSARQGVILQQEIGTINRGAKTDLSSSFISGYYNISGKSIGDTLQSLHTATDLMTARVDIKAGQVIQSNTMFAVTTSASHILVDASNKIVAFPTTAEINAGYQMSDAQIAAGACCLIVVYRISTQTETITLDSFLTLTELDADIKALDAKTAGEIDALEADTADLKEITHGCKTDMVSSFVSGYYNINGLSVGDTIPSFLTSSTTLMTARVDIKPGQIVRSNTTLVVGSAVGHILVDADDKVVAFPTTAAINAGYQMSDAEAAAGGCTLIVVYRNNDTQTAPITLVHYDTFAELQAEIDGLGDELAQTQAQIGAANAYVSGTIIDYSDTFEDGYYNANGKSIGDTMAAYKSGTTNPTLRTAIIPIARGQMAKSNAVLTTTNAVKHYLLDEANVIVAFPTTAEINAGYQLTEAQIAKGACQLVVVYRIADQSTPITLTLSDPYTYLKQRLGGLLTNKTIVMCGDSQLGQAQGMEDMLIDIIKCPALNCGFGGCRMTWRTADGSNKWDPFTMIGVADALATQNFTGMEAQLTDPDIPSYFATAVNRLKGVTMADGRNIVLTIAYGGNDYNSNVQLGDIAVENKRTFLGALAYSVRVLLEAYPRLTILLVGIPYRVVTYDADHTITSDSDDATNSLGLHRYDYNDAVLDAGKALKLPAFDMYRRSGRNKYNVWTLCPTDGTHPTSLAGKHAEAELYAKILQTF